MATTTKDTAHTPGPWTVGRWLQLTDFDRIEGFDGVEVRGTTDQAGVDRDKTKERRVVLAVWDPGTHRDEARANARRIVAAVNAVEGIPVEALEDGVVSELLERAGAAAEWLRELGKDPAALDAAIARAKGGD